MAYGYGPLRRPVGETLAAIQAGLVRGYRAEYRPAHRRSSFTTRRLRRIRGWSREIGRLASQADRVVREILPRIEQDTGYSFRDPDGLVRILLHPSTARLFLTIRAGFPDAALPIPADDLTLLAAFPDGAHAAAIVGDVTLQVKVLSGEQAPAAEFAALADRWGLSACRTGSPAGGGPAQEKETLARAVLGLLYVDGGTGALRAVAPLLVPARKL
jgi:hypothetical protein